MKLYPRLLLMKRKKWEYNITVLFFVLDDATMEHEDNYSNNCSDEEENEANGRNSGNYLKEEKSLRDLAEKK